MESVLIAHRLTAYALISSIENDLRQFISYKCRQCNILELYPEDVRLRASERFEKSGLSSKGLQVDSDFELLPYTDFSDLSKIINRHLEAWDETAIDLKQLSIELNDLISARNNVCHSRPLEPDDFALLYDFSIEIQTKYKHIPWNELQNTFALMKSNPISILSWEIPRFWAESEHYIFNNLPSPEFDETGFLGRKEDLAKIKKKILSSHPLTTIVGEGGIGKTAITVKCLYDIAFDPTLKGRFDAIVWTSLKSKKLTSKGIIEISDAIKDALGLATNALNQLSGQDEMAPLGDKLIALSEYMGLFKILLVIDNFETIEWTDLRDFLSEIPSGSKILITSRVGLGELEERIPLGPLDNKTAISLLRRSADSQSCDFLKTEKNIQLETYCNKLFNNPLLIKWFVNSVSMGKDPTIILSGSSTSLDKAISFCFENLFERLSPLERQILFCLIAARQPVTQAQLFFLLDSPNRDEFDFALNKLHHSSILIRNLKNSIMIYSVSQIASEFVNKITPPSQEQFLSFNSKMRELKKITQEEEIKTSIYKYDISAVHVTNMDESIAASYLRKAIQQVQNRDYTTAEALIEQAKSIAPLYSEVYRISGYLNTHRNEYYKATNDYEQAIELSPNNTLPLYNYAYFQYKFLEDYPLARKTCENALTICPDDIALQTLHAMLINRLGEWEKACQEYEVIIENKQNIDPRWLISTLDQAADAYKRLGEHYTDQKQFDKGRSALIRGIEIIEFVLDEFKPDLGLHQKYEKLLHQAFTILRRDYNEPFGIKIKSRLDYFVSVFGNSILNHSRTQSFLEEYRFIPVAPLPELSEYEAIEHSIGTIIKLAEEKNYGFIAPCFPSTSQRLFFHRSEIKFHLRDLVIGKKINYKIGSNHLGVCAVDIHLEPD